MVIEPTGRREGRPSWNLLADRDRYLVASFWATQIFENQIVGSPKATRHAIAIFYAVIERGEIVGSRENLAVISIGEGKLKFRAKFSSRRQFEEHPDAHNIKKRADDILRRARWAMESNCEWIKSMAGAFAAAYYYPQFGPALLHARINCLDASEYAFFERSLKPFIIGRFDPSKRVVFSLPEFMPNFVPAKP